MKIGLMRMTRIKILLIIPIILMLMSCATTNYWKDSGCRQKVERHYDAKGKYVGSTWYTVCDKEERK
jgi:hypothetical protein